jgi:hypothetical protein
LSRDWDAVLLRFSGPSCYDRALDGGALHGAMNKVILLVEDILTASKDEEGILKGDSPGANAYVRKPVAFAEFAETAETLGLFWLLLNEPAPTSRGTS